MRMVKVTANPQCMLLQICGDPSHLPPSESSKVVVTQKRATLFRTENDVVKQMLMTRHD